MKINGIVGRKKEIEILNRAFHSKKRKCWLFMVDIGSVKQVTKTKKDIFLCLVTPSPTYQNVYYDRHIHNEINLNDLFK